MKTSLCHCGGSHSQVEDKRRRLCQRQNCPRATLGQGSWRLALPKLRALHDEGELFEHFPELNIRKLEEHVARAKGTSRRRSHRRIRCRYSVDRKIPGERSRSQRRESVLQRATSSSSLKFRISADSVASSSGLQLSPLEATQQGASSRYRDNTVNLSQIKDVNRKAQRDVTPVNRYSEDNRSYDNLTSLCSSQYSHLSLLVMKELVKDAVQSVTFNAWVNFAGGRIARRLRKSLALVSRAIHAPPQSLFSAHREVTPYSHIGVYPRFTSSSSARTRTPSPSARTRTPSPSTRVDSDDPWFVTVSRLSCIPNQDKQQPFSSIENPASCSRRECIRNRNRASTLRTTSTGFDAKD